MLSHTSKYSELTDTQFAALGRVLIESSNIEYLLQIVIARLLRAPDYPTLAVTNQLGYSQRLNALKILIDTHRRRYHGKLINVPILDKLSALIGQIDRFRIDRNQCAHYLWFRDTDKKVFGIKFTGKHGNPKKPNQDSITFTVAELNLMGTKMHIIVDDLIAILKNLPEKQEV